jgi:ketosteroid isomerase-like protein
MKIWSRVMLVLALVALVGGTLIACGGGGSSTSSPEDTVRSFLNATKSGDCSSMAKLCADQVFDDMGMGKDEFIDVCKEGWEEVEYSRISNLEIDVEDISQDEATVVATYHYEEMMKDGDEPDEYDEDATFYLVKENGKWLIENMD